MVYLNCFLRSCAFNAAMMVLKLISTAPNAGQKAIRAADRSEFSHAGSAGVYLVPTR